MPAEAVTVTAIYEDITYKVIVNSGTGSNDYAEGASVTIAANEPASGKRFKAWTGTDGLVFTSGGATTAMATFTMPADAVTVTATYEDIPPATYTVTVKDGTGSNSYAEGVSVIIKANEPAPGKRFKAWTGTDGLVFTSGSATTATATFTMPAEAVTVTATYEDITYVVTVYGGSGDGAYSVGADVNIVANEPEIGAKFKEWTGTEDLIFTHGDKSTAQATFTMPAKEVTLTAIFEDIQNYTVIWLNGDGTELDCKSYYEGQDEPTTDKHPRKEAEGSAYVFVSWDDGSVEGSTTIYRPVFAEAIFHPTDASAPGIGVANGGEGTKIVVLCSLDPKAQIFYTTDGSDPASAGMLYDGPIFLQETAVIKAVAVMDGSRSSITCAKISVPKQAELETTSSLMYGEVLFFNPAGEVLDHISQLNTERNVLLSFNADFVQKNLRTDVVFLFLACYDTDGRMLGVEYREMNVSDCGVLMIGKFELPEGTIGSLRVFTTSGMFIPLLQRLSLV